MVNPERRIPLLPLLAAVIAYAVMCAGGVVIAMNVVPRLSGKPETRILVCDMEEHKVPFPTEAGFAQVTFEITNLSSTDRIYLVDVVVRTAKGGPVVGSAEHRVGVPGGHIKQDTWRVTLTKQGGRFCEVAEAVSE